MTARELTSLFKTSLIDSLAIDLSAIGGQGIEISAEFGKIQRGILVNLVVRGWKVSF